MKTKPTLMLALATALSLTLASPAVLAHSDDYLDTQKATNGGQLRMAGAYHYELVVVKDSKEAQDNPVLVYLTDHAGTKIPATGASGTVTLLTGKAKTTTNLAPDGDNRLKGTARYASTPDMKVIVSITLPGKNAEQARFTPLAPVKAAPAAHAH